MTLRVVLTAQAPLAFRAGRNTGRSETIPYVPGTSLIGGLAQAHQSLGRNAGEFEQFFLQDEVVFANCYPAMFTTDGQPTPELQGGDRPVYPIPLTARTCKRFRGFAYNAELESADRAGVTDALIRLALFAMSGERRFDVLAPLDQHPKTHQPLDRFSGFFRQGSQREAIAKSDQPMGLRTRTGINYETGTARETILYSRQTLLEGSTFWGAWRVPAGLMGPFATFLDQVVERSLLRVGNNRTRGFGLVGLSSATIAEDTVEALQLRVETFTRALKTVAADIGISAPADAYIPLTLTSDMLLYDPLLRARLRLTTNDMAAAGIVSATLVFHAASVRHVTGWSTLWGLPKADEWAISMGSVFLFALDRPEVAIYQALLQLQETGLGARRAEGFGGLMVAHPFHIDLAERYL